MGEAPFEEGLRENPAAGSSGLTPSWAPQPQTPDTFMSSPCCFPHTSWPPAAAARHPQPGQLAPRSLGASLLGKDSPDPCLHSQARLGLCGPGQGVTLVLPDAQAQL